MADSITPPCSLRDFLTGLPGVRVRRMFGTDAFFAAGVLFAFLGDEGLVLRLPATAKSMALESGLARSYLGRLPGEVSGWVVVPYGTAVEELVESAHLQAQALARARVRRKGRTRRARGKKAG